MGLGDRFRYGEIMIFKIISFLFLIGGSVLVLAGVLTADASVPAKLLLSGLALFAIGVLVQIGNLIE